MSELIIGFTVIAVGTSLPEIATTVVASLRGEWDIAVAIARLPIFFIGGAISRGEGIMFLAYYLAYVGHLVLQATEHSALPGFHPFMFVFALPLTVVTLVALIIRTFRANRRSMAIRASSSEQ